MPKRRNTCIHMNEFRKNKPENSFQSYDLAKSLYDMHKTINRTPDQRDIF